MFSPKHIVLCLLVAANLIAVNLCAQKGPSKRSGSGWRYNIGTSLNNYTLNDKHGINPKQRLSFTLGMRREKRVTRDYKSFVLFGAEYLLHGVNYQSYYFGVDSLKLYDRKYDYNYSLTIQEIHLPFEFKYLLRRADNSPFSPYFLIGYHLRYLMPTFVKVYKADKVFVQDTPNLVFRTWLINPKVNASLCLALGWQINKIGTTHRSFFAEVNFQYGFSDYYFKSEYSANAMYINCIQATFNLGAKF